MTDLRRMVLISFKKLHRTRLKVFSGDERALTAARIRINEEYAKNKHVDNVEAIKAMIKYGEDVERELRTQIIQAKEIRPGVFENFMKKTAHRRVLYNIIKGVEIAKLNLISMVGYDLNTSHCEKKPETNSDTMMITFFKDFDLAEARITEETVKLENIPFNDKAEPDDGIKGSKQCCQDQAQNK